MKVFSFLHAADLHLGYSQYGLETRRGNFDRVFVELVDAVTYSEAFAEKAEHVVRLEKEGS